MKTFSPQVHAYEENVSWPSQVACSPRLTFHIILTSVISRRPHDKLFCSHRLYPSGQCCFLKVSWVPREPSWTLDNPAQSVSYQRQPTAPSSSSEASHVTPTDSDTSGCRLVTSERAPGLSHIVPNCHDLGRCFQL